MAFQALPLEQKTFRGVHVCNHADQRGRRRNSEFISQKSGPRTGERFRVDASVGQENAAGVNSQLQVFLVRPAARGDPTVASASEGDVEPGEEAMFKVEWARNFKDARDRRIFAEGEARDESGADVMSVDEVRADVGDKVTASAKRGRDAPGLARRQIEIGANNSRSGFAIFWGESFGVTGQRDDYFDAERAEDADLFVGPVGADGGLDDVQNLHGGDHSNPEWRMR